MSLKDSEVFEMFRFRIQNENELIHYRMSWFIPLQSFLFISLAVFSNGNLVTTIGPYFISGVSFLGIVSASVTLKSVHSAIEAMNKLEETWQETAAYERLCDQIPSLMGANHRISSEKPVLRRNGTWITFGMPGAALLFWLAVMAVAIGITSGLIQLSDVATTAN
ncbi:hypothetical protein [Marivita sp.]|uniref:hypothetical protein n=1 Tax=Marivita sp. TaxID=2003365 RepID=UPI00262BB9AA|nr:hypothetical protein [Marivita sp.]